MWKCDLGPSDMSRNSDLGFRETRGLRCGGGVVPYVHSASYVVFVTGLDFLWTFWDGSGMIGMPDGGNQKISGSSGSAIALLCVWYEYAFAFSKQVRRGRQRRQGPAATARGAPLYPRHTAPAGPARGFVTPGAGVSLPPPGARMLLWNELRS